jgi:hypothetical protein
LWDILFSFLRAQEADALMDERVRLLPASDPRTLKTGADIAMTELNVVEIDPMRVLLVVAYR